MNLRHAAALALWVSRILAVILLAIPIAWWGHVSGARDLNWISADPKSFLLYQQRIHSYSMARNIRALSVFGSIYIGSVEALAWCLRKVAGHATAEFRTDH